jgi:hypothetical protein
LWPTSLRLGRTKSACSSREHRDSSNYIEIVVPGVALTLLDC